MNEYSFQNKPRKAIIIGATSGIGKALAELLAAKNFTLGLSGRRQTHLENLENSLPTKSYIQTMDVSKPSEATQKFKSLLNFMDGTDIVIISAGTGHHNPTLNFDLEADTINTNILGFTAIAGEAIKYFQKQNHGHLVAISSIACLTGNASAPAYNASKAYMANYLSGLRNKVKSENRNITVTDIRPGYVDTAMAQSDNLFWVAPPKKAALQIYSAIETKKSCVYITRRWRIIAWLLKIKVLKLFK